MKNNIKICIIILFIFSLKLSHANNLFESSFENIEFQSNNIVNNKNLHINELKIFSISNILKNILINNHYKKIRNKIDTQFADSLVKNIIIEDEKILSDRYSANIKINYDKDLIINFLRNEKLPYVENLPDNFLTIILDQKNIKKNLFTKENNYYDFLLNNDQDYLNFYKIPNLDINDRFLISPKDIINRNLININKFLKKYILIIYY